MSDDGRIPIGISTCLLGQAVRFDGGHKRDRYLTETLGRYFRWVPVCPEVEIGLGTPRESLRLVGDPDSPRLVAPRSGSDHTDSMRTWARERLVALEKQGLRGYILKKDSPSCGMERVKVYGEAGMPQRQGRGVFAMSLLDRFPLLPVEEEGRLHDLPLRENWIERVFAFHRWRQLRDARPKPRDLVDFHTQSKLALMAHSPKHYREMGRLVAGAGASDTKGEARAREFSERLDRYGALFMDALRLRATPRKHTNVLHHLMGFLKRGLEAGDKAELLGLIEEYRQGRVPLIVPLTLLKHHFRRHPAAWAQDQTYLNPYPDELMLRNHV